MLGLRWSGSPTTGGGRGPNLGGFFYAIPLPKGHACLMVEAPVPGRVRTWERPTQPLLGLALGRGRCGPSEFLSGIKEGVDAVVNTTIMLCL